MAEPAPILTIGYAGAAPEALVECLHAAGTRTLIDVRDRPWSRRPQFSRIALAEALAEAGIDYVHLAGLGTPSEGREAARAGRRQAFERALGRRLDGPEGESALAGAGRLARDAGPICLLCLEADPLRCHRSIVAERLARRLGAGIRHLRPSPTPDQGRLSL